MFPNQNCMKLEISIKKKFWKFTNMWKLNKMVLNDQRVKNEIISKIRKYFDMNENENTTH